MRLKARVEKLERDLELREAFEGGYVRNTAGSIRRNENRLIDHLDKINKLHANFMLLLDHLDLDLTYDNPVPGKWKVVEKTREDRE